MAMTIVILRIKGPSKVGAECVASMATKEKIVGTIKMVKMQIKIVITTQIVVMMVVTRPEAVDLMVMCHYCGTYGHRITYCWIKRRDEGKKNDDDGTDDNAEVCLIMYTRPHVLETRVPPPT